WSAPARPATTFGTLNPALNTTIFTFWIWGERVTVGDCDFVVVWVTEALGLVLGPGGEATAPPPANPLARTRMPPSRSAALITRRVVPVLLTGAILPRSLPLSGGAQPLRDATAAALFAQPPQAPNEHRVVRECLRRVDDAVQQ